jgi:ATP-dependent Clp protease, protease subunit
MSYLDRKLYINGEISNESYLVFAKKLSRLEVNYPGQTIQVEITSDGGDSESGLAFFDRIRNSPNQIVTVAYGLVASAASLVFAAGHKRFMAPNAWLMVHEESLKMSDKVSTLERDIKHFREIEDQYSTLMAGVSTTDKTEWDRLNTNETYINAKYALQLGIADGIFDHKILQALVEEE